MRDDNVPPALRINGHGVARGLRAGLSWKGRREARGGRRTEASRRALLTSTSEEKKNAPARRPGASVRRGRDRTSERGAGKASRRYVSAGGDDIRSA